MYGIRLSSFIFSFINSFRIFSCRKSLNKLHLSIRKLFPLWVLLRSSFVYPLNIKPRNFSSFCHPLEFNTHPDRSGFKKTPLRSEFNSSHSKSSIISNTKPSSAYISCSNNPNVVVFIANTVNKGDIGDPWGRPPKTSLSFVIWASSISISVKLNKYFNRSGLFKLGNSVRAWPGFVFNNCTRPRSPNMVLGPHLLFIVSICLFNSSLLRALLSIIRRSRLILDGYYS